MKKKIILSSILSIVLCLSVICGATFALFTDTDEVNVAVTSGKVNVSATVDESLTQVKSLDTAWTADSLNFTNGGSVFFAGNTLQLNLITPGDAVLFAINVKNDSNISIRYRTKIAVVEGDKLFSALNVYMGESVDALKAAAEEGTTSSLYYDGSTKITDWSEVVPAAEKESVVKTVYVLIEFPNLDTDQNDLMDENTKIAFTVEAVQGNADLDQLTQITTGITPIYSVTDLRLVAENVANGTTYKGQTVVLMNDIDFGSADWEPIGTTDLKHAFQGTFTSYDAKNPCTIKNLKVKADAGEKAGLFGYISDGAVISYVNVENATITGADRQGTAVLVANAHAGTTIESCRVVNATLTGSDYIGAICGSTYGKILNCSVEDVELIATPYQTADGTYDGGAKAGAILGYSQSDGDGVVLSGNSATDVVVTAYRDLGGLAGGVLSAKATVTNNSVTNVKLVVDRDYNYCESAAANYGFGIGRGGTNFPDGVTVSGTTELVLVGENEPVTVSGNTTLTLRGATINATEGHAVTLAEGYTGSVVVAADTVNTFVGATGGSGIYAKTANVNVTGAGSLTVIGNAGADDANGGSGIYSEEGNVVIDGLTKLIAKGYGEAGFGVGGANVTITNTHIEYAKGGYVQQSILAGNYGKDEPEGGPAIGSMVDGAKIVLTNVTTDQIVGGSKAAGIGARYWTAIDVEITNCTLTEVIGGNASAAIGGSRIASDGATQTTTVKIVDSVIKAIGGEYGAGIGSGYDVHCASTKEEKAPKNTVTILGTSFINAQGGKYAAGIGGGYHAGNVEVSIADSATITAASGDKFYKAEYWSAQDIGRGVVDPTRDVDDLGYVGITCAEHLLAWADEINNNKFSISNNGNTVDKNTTIVLLADIDLTGKEWTPIVTSSANFTFDGNKHTINGMTVTNGTYGGLVGKNNNASMTIKNLTLTNVNMTGTNQDGECAAGAIIGYYEDHTNSTVTIENCHVDGMTVKDFKYMGGLVGYTSNSGGSMTITNSTVKNATLISNYAEEGDADENGAVTTVAKGHVGGLVGRVHSTTVTGCTTENVIITTSCLDRAGAICGTVTDSTMYKQENNTNGVTIAGLISTQEALSAAVTA